MTTDFNGNIAAGILLHGENQRQADLSKAVKEMEQQSKINNLNDQLSETQDVIEKLKKESEIDDYVRETLAHHLRIYKQAISYYKELLTKPMHIIADHNEDFKKTYVEQQIILADWMVSQKSFKELSIKYGEKLGLTSVEVRREADKNYTGVLNGNFNPIHQTTAGEFIARYRDRLLERFSKPTNFITELEELISKKELYPINIEGKTKWYEAFDSWYQLALNEDGKAQFNVGRCFHFGDGVAVSHKDAVYWYEKALSNHEPMSAFNLYALYTFNDSDGKLNDKQQNYLNIACKLGDERALKEKSRLAQIELDENLQIERQVKQQRQIAEAMVREKNHNSALKILENMRIIKQGAKFPAEEIKNVSDLDNDVGKFLTLCYKMKISVEYGKVKNIGTFLKPIKAREVRISLSHDLDKSLFLIYPACFEDEYSKEKSDLKAIAMSDNKVFVIKRDALPIEHEIKKIMIWPKFNLSNPIVIYLQ